MARKILNIVNLLRRLFKKVLNIPVFNVIGGCSSAYTAEQVNEAADAINNNYDNGTSDDGFLTCIICDVVASSSAGEILCNGGTTTVVVSATGGTPPYSGTGEFTVGAGDYSYTVTDANGCEATTSVSVSEPSLLEASSSAGEILCNGGTTTVTVSASGGTPPYSGTGEFEVGAGDYSYTVTDANGCEAVTSVSVSEPSLLEASSSAGEILCNGGTTTVTVSASGGTAP